MRRLRRIPISVGILAAGVAFAAGCQHRSTTAERSASFQPYATATIREQPVETFLSDRFGVLIGGVKLKSAPRTPDGRLEKVEVEMSEATAFGSATAIDRRGYLLTAAHAVQHEPVYLFIGADHKAQIEQARVVWCGDPKKKEPDLALVKIPLPIDAVFEWADNFQRSDPVIAAGLNSEKYFNFDFGSAAGKISTIVHRTTRTPPYDLIFHKSPLHGGDSGGPLVSPAGQLIGINTNGTIYRLWPFSYTVALAQRPDLPWLRKLIEDDFALHPNTPAGAQ